MYEINDIVRNFMEAIQPLMDRLEEVSKALKELLDIYEESVEKSRITSPKQYGLKLNTRKHEERTHDTYRYIPAVQRNLSYQRRSY